jgi:hypothetical protein
MTSSQWILTIGLLAGYFGAGFLLFVLRASWAAKEIRSGSSSDFSKDEAAFWLVFWPLVVAIMAVMVAGDWIAHRGARLGGWTRSHERRSRRSE